MAHDERDRTDIINDDAQYWRKRCISSLRELDKHRHLLTAAHLSALSLLTDDILLEVVREDTQANVVRLHVVR